MNSLSILKFLFTFLFINIAILSYSQSYISPPKLYRTYSVVVHIVQDSIAKDNITTAAIAAKFDSLNTLFDTIKVKFQVCSTRRIINYNFAKFRKDSMQLDLLAKHYEPNHINLYLVSKLEEPQDYDDGLSTIDGITKDFDTIIQLGDTTLVRPYIMMTKKAIFKGWGRHFGHFFGLYNTFETRFGPEVVARKGCDTTGDLVCDTEAYDGQANYEDILCYYTGTSVDTSGVFMRPQINNLMSNFQACKDRFTIGQYIRMANRARLRRYLYY